MANMFWSCIISCSGDVTPAAGALPLGALRVLWWLSAQLGVQGARLSFGLPGLVAAVEVAVEYSCYLSCIQVAVAYVDQWVGFS